MKLFLAISALFCAASAQVYLQQPIPYGFHSQPTHHVIKKVTSPLAHKAVIENSIRESQYPSEYLNKFYDNPRVAAGLAEASWLTDKEMPVFEREADKVPREEIFKIINHAQFVHRR